MLDQLGRPEAGAAVETLLASKDAPKTPDLGENARTAAIAEAVIGYLPERSQP